MCEGVALVLNIIFETQFNIYQFILKYLVKYFKYKAKWGGKSILFAKDLPFTRMLIFTY